MAKIVKKAQAPDAQKPKAEAASRHVAGAGFRKTYTATELSDIQTKRREMRERLFAAG
jgi:hypothetical protein